jgi:hypothetical protein
MSLIQKLMLMCVPVPEADGHRLKRERQISEREGAVDDHVVSKTVKIWPVEQPVMQPGDEMYGRSKVARVQSKDGCVDGMVLQQSLSDDDKG